MPRAQTRVSCTTVLPKVKAFAKARGLSLYLVGGMIRDTLLGRATRQDNVDFALPSDTLTNRGVDSRAPGPVVPARRDRPWDSRFRRGSRRPIEKTGVRESE